MKCFTDKLEIFEMLELSFWLDVKRSGWLNTYRHAPPVNACHFLLLHVGVRYKKCPLDNWLVNFFFFYDGRSWLLEHLKLKNCYFWILFCCCFVLVGVCTVLFWCLVLLKTYKSFLIIYSLFERHFVQLTMQVLRQKCIITLWFTLPTYVLWLSVVWCSAMPSHLSAAAPPAAPPSWPGCRR